MRAHTLREHGMTLVVALILLTLMTVMAITTLNLSKISIGIAGNLQQRSEVLTAANTAIEAAISSTRLFKYPSQIFTSPCDATNNKWCVDTNGDGVNDVAVMLTPTPRCVELQTVKNATLNLSKVDDQACAISATQGFGIESSVTGDSLCADMLWEIVASANDTVTGAQNTVTEGVAVRISTDDQATSCPP